MSWYTCISLPAQLIMTTNRSVLLSYVIELRFITLFYDDLVDSLRLFFFSYQVPWTNISPRKRKQCDLQYKNGSSFFDQKLAARISLEFKR